MRLLRLRSDRTIRLPQSQMHLLIHPSTTDHILYFAFDMHSYDGASQKTCHSDIQRKVFTVSPERGSYGSEADGVCRGDGERVILQGRATFSISGVAGSRAIGLRFRRFRLFSCLGVDHHINLYKLGGKAAVLCII